jgi:hypothetical protein
VTVFIDTGVIPRTGRLDTLEFATFLAVARETGHSVAIPELVLSEAESHYLRVVEALFDGLQKSHRDAASYAAIPLLGELPVPGELAREYRRRLESIGDVVATPAGAGDEGLRREAFRLRPARLGKGARDTAIWLTVKEAHGAAPAENYLLSTNTRDFADPADSRSLHPDLRGELADENLQLATSVAHLLELLAAEEDSVLDLAFLEHEDVCARAIQHAVHGVDLEPVLVAATGQGLGAKQRPFVSGVITTTPLGVNASRGFTVEGRRVAVGWTRWRVSAPIGILERVSSGMTATTVEVSFEANIHLWARVDVGGAVTAEASSVSNIRQIED